MAETPPTPEAPPRGFPFVTVVFSLAAFFGSTDAFHALLREVSAEGRTVFLSSHTLSEVERVTDRLAILRQGRLVVVDSLENLRKVAVQRLELEFGEDVDAAEFRGLPGVKQVAPRLRSDALITSGATSVGVALSGVDPAIEPLISKIDTPRSMVAGEALSPTPGVQARSALPPIVIGKELARTLDVQVGDRVTLSVRPRGGGETRSGAYAVHGVFATGVHEVPRVIENHHDHHDAAQQIDRPEPCSNGGANGPGGCRAGHRSAFV